VVFLSDLAEYRRWWPMAPVEFGEQPLMGGREYDQQPAPAEPIHGPSEFLAIVFDVFQYVDVEDRVKMPADGQILQRADDDLGRYRWRLLLIGCAHRLGHLGIGLQRRPTREAVARQNPRVGPDSSPNFEHVSRKVRADLRGQIRLPTYRVPEDL
jgi:hypothetical protein